MTRPGNLSGMMRRLGLDPVPAEHAVRLRAGAPAAIRFWPTGVSLLAQMVDACQRCEATEVCDDWLARAPQFDRSAAGLLPERRCLDAGEESEVDTDRSRARATR